jgi:hypothetical protein
MGWCQGEASNVLFLFLHAIRKLFVKYLKSNNADFLEGCGYESCDYLKIHFVKKLIKLCVDLLSCWQENKLQKRFIDDAVIPAIPKLRRH